MIYREQQHPKAQEMLKVIICYITRREWKAEGTILHLMNVWLRQGDHLIQKLLFLYLGCLSSQDVSTNYAPDVGTRQRAVVSRTAFCVCEQLSSCSSYQRPIISANLLLCLWILCHCAHTTNMFIANFKFMRLEVNSYKIFNLFCVVSGVTFSWVSIYFYSWHWNSRTAIRF